MVPNSFLSQNYKKVTYCKNLNSSFHLKRTHLVFSFSLEELILHRYSFQRFHYTLLPPSMTRQEQIFFVSLTSLWIRSYNNEYCEEAAGGSSNRTNTVSNHHTHQWKPCRKHMKKGISLPLQTAWRYAPVILWSKQLNDAVQLLAAPGAVFYTKYTAALCISGSPLQTVYKWTFDIVTLTIYCGNAGNSWTSGFNLHTSKVQENTKLPNLLRNHNLAVNGQLTSTAQRVKVTAFRVQFQSVLH